MTDEKQNFMTAVRYLIGEAKKMGMPQVAARLIQVLRVGKTDDSASEDPDAETKRTKDDTPPPKSPI